MDLKINELRLAAKQYFDKCPRTKERLLALIELEKRTKSKRGLKQLDYERVAAEFGKTVRTIFRWKKSWDEAGIKGLVPKVSPGRKKRPVNGFTAKKIREYRKKYNWGAEVMQAHLKLDFGQKISEGRIHRFLSANGFIVKKKKKLKNKHTKVVKVAEPGAHTQSDVKHLPHLLASGEKCYVYNFVDHASKTEIKKAYLSYGALETKNFVELVLKKVPFVITRWQTDNGIECTYKYVSLVDKPKKHILDKLCEKNNIRHVLIPPGEKELQGLVERNHRMDDEELYHRIRPNDINEFNRYLEAHYKWKNSSRRRKSLDWKTPNQWLKEHSEKIVVELVRQKDPVDSVEKTPSESPKPDGNWQRGIVEIWSNMDKEKRPEKKQQTEDQALSVESAKKAA